MQNSRLDESQAGIKIARRTINNLRYADDTTLLAESKEELKSLLMKVKEENEKSGLNSTFKKLRSQHSVPSLHSKDREKYGSSDRFSSLQRVTATMKLKGTCFLEEKL